MLEPIKNSVVFAFEDKVINGRFVESTDSGIYLGKDHTRDANAPRWATVLAVGPEVDAVKNRDRILIEASQWTYGMVYDGVSLWRTTEDKILCIDPK